jgi:hypothetical protein
MAGPPPLVLDSLHEAFLRFSDGGSFGAVDIWSSQELAPNQYRAEWSASGREQQVEVGQLVYEPVFLRRSDGAVLLPEFEGAKPVAIPNFDILLEEYVFGPGYVRLFEGAEQEDWYEFLRSCGFA